MQAIVCKYVTATDSRGSRIKATCAACSIYIPYPHELSGQAVYRAAAEQLAEKMGWTGDYYGRLIGGCLKNGTYVFVFDNALSKE